MRRSVLLSLCTLFATCSSYNILVLFPHVGRSHHYAFEPLFRALLDRGHNLTAVTHFALEDPPPNYRLIDLAGSYRIYEALMTFDRQKGSILGSYFHLKDVYEYIRLGLRVCDVFLEWPAVESLYGSNDRYDAVITELFNSDCSLGFVDKFKAPHVALASHLMMPWGGERMGSVDNPSFVPMYFSQRGSRMTFWERVENTAFLYYHKMTYFFASTRVEERMLRRRFGEEFPDLEDVARNTSLVLLNAHHSLSGVVPRSPNVVEVGGMHIKRPKPLSKDLETYINESPSGVIYFSLGSMIKATSISKERLAAMQQVFSGLPQRVLWKWENDTMDGKPDNVMIRKWLPQMDILSHPNVKAFISHAGMLGTTEAAHCGVPVVCIPLFGDQFANAAAAQESGLGVTLHYKDITKATFSDALARVLGPSMQKSAKRLSAIWRDRPQPPLETAVYWIEHVARHGGDHLRPASVDLPLVQYLLLDVLAFFALVAIVVAFVTYKMLLFFVRVCRGSNRKTKRD